MYSITEINSNQQIDYKNFLTIGLLNDEENFRITPNDDKDASFPTKDLEDSFTLGAYRENELAGVVSFERDGYNREKLRHKGILFRMYISEKHRGKGISKLLINAVIERCIQLGNIEQINLTVISNNDTAKKLYEKIGFQKFATEHNAIKWNNKYFDEDQMVLKIKSSVG